ncbi:MAG: hypothetical protein Sapg2KO_07140 [Saprospiraceae bacterium]
MKTNHKLYIAITFYFIALILFETAQQQYYLTSFDLLGNREVSFFDLLQNHVTLWLVWTVFTLPLLVYVKKHPIQKLSLSSILQYGSRIAGTLLITLIAISCIKLWVNGQPLATFGEYLSFYTFQKAALFFTAYLGLVVFMNLHNNLQLLDLKVVALSDLSVRYKNLYDDLSQKKMGDQTPLVQIKIGNKVKNILLSEVIWVQSDDYCVKIHTKDKAYNLRKSMKAMEQELVPRGFIRVHRNSIVNKVAIDTLTFTQKPHVRLKNGQSLQIATSRIPKIKASLKIA